MDKITNKKFLIAGDSWFRTWFPDDILFSSTITEREKDHFMRSNAEVLKLLIKGSDNIAHNIAYGGVSNYRMLSEINQVKTFDPDYVIYFQTNPFRDHQDGIHNADYCDCTSYPDCIAYSEKFWNLTPVAFEKHIDTYLTSFYQELDKTIRNKFPGVKKVFLIGGNSKVRQNLINSDLLYAIIPSFIEHVFNVLPDFKISVLEKLDPHVTIVKQHPELSYPQWVNNSDKQMELMSKNKPLFDHLFEYFDVIRQVGNTDKFLTFFSPDVGHTNGNGALLIADVIFNYLESTNA